MSSDPTKTSEQKQAQPSNELNSPPTNTSNESEPSQTPSNTEATEPPQQLNKPSPEEIAHKVLQEHDAKVFRAPDHNRPISLREIEVPESFYEPTVGEITSALKTYSQRTDALANGTMKTKKMRQAEQDERMSRFRRVLIRVQFPDRVMLQGAFEPKSTVRQVRRFVRAALKHAKEVPFHLFIVPPKQLLTDMDVTLWNQGLVPKAIIHIGFEQGSDGSPITEKTVNLLKPKLIEGITDAPETQPDDPKPPAAAAKTLAGENADDTAGAKERKRIDRQKAMKKVPKWFIKK